MSKYDKLIEKKADSAQYMVDEITHICKDMPKRGPGSEGEKVACEYMAQVLKEQCGCERADLRACGNDTLFLYAGARRGYHSARFRYNGGAVRFL